MRKPSIGFIGLGALGRPMAERLLSQGFPLTVFNRTRARAEALAEKGARLAESPAAAASRAEALITVLGDDRALAEVAFGPEGVVSALPRGATHLEMSTVSRAVTLRVHAALSRRSVDFLDAPVLGSGPQAAEGDLIVMVGGPADVLERNREVLAALSHKILHVGEVGSASQLKLVANLFIASMMLGFAQAMVLAEKAGLSPRLVMELIDSSALSSPFYTGKLDRLLRRDFHPNFPARWMLKDIDLILAEGAERGVPLPGIAAARGVYVATLAAGRGDEDYSVVVEILEKMAGLR